MRIVKIRKDWPWLEPPLVPGAITVLDVLEVSDGVEKAAMIRQWMAAVWEIWADQQVWLREATDTLLVRGRGWAPTE